jgi:hypothetical protein
MSDSKTVILPRAQFASLAAKQSESFIAEMQTEQPRAALLAAELELLLEEAQRKGVTLDDAAVAKNEDAADLRRRIDPVVAEIQTLIARNEYRLNTNHAALDILDGSEEHDPNVTVPVSLAMKVMNLAPAN